MFQTINFIVSRVRLLCLVSHVSDCNAWCHMCQTVMPGVTCVRLLFCVPKVLEATISNASKIANNCYTWDLSIQGKVSMPIVTNSANTHQQTSTCSCRTG